MGLSWILAFLLLVSQHLITQIVFVVVESLQGVAILLLFIFRSRQVRKTFKMWRTRRQSASLALQGISMQSRPSVSTTARFSLSSLSMSSPTRTARFSLSSLSSSSTPRLSISSQSPLAVDNVHTGKQKRRSGSSSEPTSIYSFSEATSANNDQDVFKPCTIATNPYIQQDTSLPVVPN
eukprot:scpid25703/ scgid21965/ 